MTAWVVPELKHTISSGLVIALAVLTLLAAMQAPAMASGGPPSPGAIYGYVSVNGIAANGISVSISGPGISDTYTTGSDAAGNSGYYQFGVLKGSSYTVSASYGGKTASSTITASGPEARADLDISYSGPPMPAAVYGYVTVDGDAANDIIVTLEGNGATETYMTRNDAGGRAGYYQFGILSITSYTVTAGYNGQVVSLDFSTGAAKERADLPIPGSTGAVATVTPVPGSSTVTPTPTPTPTPSPTATPSVTPNPSDTPGDSTPMPTINPASLPSPSPVPFPGIEGLVAIALGGVILAMINRKG